MRRKIGSWSLAIAIIMTVGIAARCLAAAPEKTVAPKRAYGELPLHFEANRGQADPRVRFLCHGDGYTLFLTANEAVFTQWGATNGSPLRVTLAGSNPNPRIVGLDELRGKVNYFLGNDPTKWLRRISTFARVKYTDVYPGIDLVYYGNPQRLEYDLVVSPGVDPSVIQLAFEGVKKLETAADGDLRLRMAGGEMRFRKPLVYQQDGNGRREVAGDYELRGANGICFRVAKYDARKPLVIDPTLIYSTRLGGTNPNRLDPDVALGIAVDSDGNAYIGGYTGSTSGFPTTPGAYDSTACNTDVFVAKLNADGTDLIYSTIIGGCGGSEFARSIAIDADGNAYAAGQTRSSDYPRTAGVLDNSIGGDDGFVTKLNADGSDLLYSTALGGSADDRIYGIVVDSDHNAYVAGVTASGNFPTTPTAYSTNFHGVGPQNVYGDVFVAKINPTATALLYSTYIGGISDDAACALAVDDLGCAYVTGATASTNYPTTPGAFRTGSTEPLNTFVTKLNSTGTALDYSTLIGSGYFFSASDFIFRGGIAVDGDRNAYVTGWTNGTNFPTTVGAYRTNYVGGATDSFITKVNQDGSALVYSTFLGGSGFNLDEGNAIVVDANGNAIVGGRTYSANFPITAGAIRSSFGGDADAFVTKINASGSALIFSTFLGGNGYDVAESMALDQNGDIYVTGSTVSQNFPTTPGAFDTNYINYTKAFVTKINEANPPVETDLGVSVTDSPDPVIVNSNLSYKIVVTNLGSYTASTVIVTNTLASGVILQSAPANCTPIGNAVVCDFGSVTNRKSATATIVVMPTAIGSITNIARVTGDVTDSAVANNISTQITAVTAAPCADLTGVWTNVVETCKAKGTNLTCKLKGQFTIQNTGNALPAPSVLRFYMSSDANFDDHGDTLLQEVAIASLKPAKAKKAKLKPKSAPNVTASNQFIIAVLDADNGVTECNEDDNVVVFGPVP